MAELSYKILFAASELFPLNKTGGLGDVAYALPKALRGFGHDVRVILPGYHDVLAQLSDLSSGFVVHTPMGDAKILHSHIPDTDIQLMLVSSDHYFGERTGNPYLNENGDPWPDNSERFALFCHACAQIATFNERSSWLPDVVHCNDWQTGLIPLLLQELDSQARSLFTIHNLSYQGNFAADDFEKLKLPKHCWHSEGVEFYGQISFLKAGIVFADQLNTVSPSYAHEILTEHHGMGMHSILNKYRSKLTGILNGIDTEKWGPARDPLIEQNYDLNNPSAKSQNKSSLQLHCNLPQDPHVALIGMVTRIAYQKGIDILLAALPELLRRNLQIIILGAGEREYEQKLKQIAQTHSDKLAVTIGYDEKLAHQIEAGADLFLMPSRFEPCGLNQMYSLQYGTVPIVHKVGGLADTVVNTNLDSLKSGTANGFVIEKADTASLLQAIDRALQFFEDGTHWHAIQKHGMQSNFSWDLSAQQYEDLYQNTITGS